MAHSRATRAAAPVTVPRPQGIGAHALLYKADYPRAIDRYIDFFGEGALLTDTGGDRCGDLLLESLA
jgi:hypothetical protein